MCAAGSCGSQNRTFTIPSPTAEAQEHAEPNETQTETESGSGSGRRLHKADKRGNDREHSSHAGHGQQGSFLWTSGSSSQTYSHSGQEQEQQEGLAHVFASGHGQGLALALGHVECSVVNNTVQIRGCRDTCELPNCAGAPALDSQAGSETAVTVTSWECTDVGTANATSCAGSCPVGNSTGSISATCLDGDYTIASTGCVAV